MNRRTIMPLMEHIIELRKLIIAILGVFAVSMAIGIAVSPLIIDYIKHTPPASRMEWNVFSPFDGIRMYMTVACAFAFTVSLPAALFLLWSFVKKGLHLHERQAALRYIPYSALCLLLGIAFGYYVVLPMSFSFVTSISEKMNLVETYGIAQYFSFMLNLILPIAASFELPIVVMFLTRIGLLTPERLRKSRRYTYPVLVIVANLLSPPDFVSAFIILVPLAALFEISLFLSRLADRKRPEPETGAEAAA
ncbi:twin-arginine translocase subunit TatC [Paenibacillus arenilitoris]|uniref:Sec-independent protein translocase protein TatC n=1 Tax=Paenibacillus arenilitoris TaxID=2772299 RepID=A0A927CLC9_9BACL|nr:twin-arginine translocase subunit TatC [Paenibacillus arenilitoris]MBD2867760.1 twin-arginine translocase subunit TatC [Paenibacillus arenilitoris]